MNELGTAVRSLFEDYLKVQKGLRPSSIRSYRDVLKLWSQTTTVVPSRASN